MTNRDEFYDATDDDLGAGVSLINSDGGIVYCFPLNRLGRAATFSRSTPLGGETRVPAGAYYIAPGIVGQGLAVALLDAIRDGRQAALDAAGVPQIQAMPGQTASISFDGRAARDAIVSVASDLMPSP